MNRIKATFITNMYANNNYSKSSLTRYKKVYDGLNLDNRNVFSSTRFLEYTF